MLIIDGVGGERRGFYRGLPRIFIGPRRSILSRTQGRRRLPSGVFNFLFIFFFLFFVLFVSFFLCGLGIGQFMVG